MVRIVTADITDPVAVRILGDRNLLQEAGPAADIYVEQYLNGMNPFLFAGCYNWSGALDNTEPTIADDVVFTTTGAGTLVLSVGEVANSLAFNSGTYILGSVGVGTLTLGNPGQASAGTISVTNTLTATINSTLLGSSGITKTTAGTLTLRGGNYLTGGITISASGGTIDVAGASRIALGNNAITLNGGTVALGNNLTPPVYLREFSGSVSLGADMLELRVSALNDTTFSGGIGSSIQGVGLNKTGPGTLSITGVIYERGNVSAVNTCLTAVWRGGLTFGGTAGALLAGGATPEGAILYGGTLTLDNSTVNLADRYGAMPVTVTGGSTFRYIGAASANSTETLGALTISGQFLSSGSTLLLAVNPGSSGTAALTFASYSYFSGSQYDRVASILNVITTGTLGTSANVLFTTAPTLRNNVMPGAFVNGTDIATYDATKGVIPFNAVGGGGTAYVAAASAVAADTAYANANYQLTANKQWTALKLDGPVEIDLNGNTLTLGVSGDTNGLAAMVVKAGTGEAVITNSSATVKYFTANGGGGGQSANYSFMVNDGVLRITAPLTGGTLALKVNTLGNGVLWLDPFVAWNSTKSYGTGASAYGSGIYFADGVIRLNPSDTKFGNETMVLNGGVMEITGGGTYSPTISNGNANVMWQSSGGFAAYGADATVSPNITWNAASHIPDGAALLLNSATADSKITLSGTLNLGTDAAKMYLREINVVSGANANAVAEISGKIISNTLTDETGTATDTYHLVKTGAGTLILSNANNNYSGATYVKEGTLRVNGTLATPASSAVALNSDYSAVTVMSGATLGGNGTINRPVTVNSGGTLKPGTDGTGTLTVGALTMSGGNLELSGTGETVCGKIVSSGAVSLSGTLTLTGTPTETEYILVSSGTELIGTFSNYANNATISWGSKTYVVTYTDTAVKLAFAPGGMVIMIK